MPKQWRDNEVSRIDGKRNIRNSRPAKRMVPKDNILSRAARMTRETSETHDLWKE
jgi:hypothetical protein